MEKLKNLIKGFCESVNPVDGHASHFTDVERLVLVANYAFSHDLAIEENDFSEALAEKFAEGDAELLHKFAREYKAQAEEYCQVIKIIKSKKL